MNNKTPEQWAQARAKEVVKSLGASPGYLTTYEGQAKLEQQITTALAAAAQDAYERAANELMYQGIQVGEQSYTNPAGRILRDHAAEQWQKASGFVRALKAGQP